MSNASIAFLYIDWDLFPVVISLDTLPVSDVVNWVFSPADSIYQPRDSQPLAGGTGSSGHWCDGELSSLGIRETSVGSLKEEGIPPVTLWRQLRLRADLNSESYLTFGYVGVVHWATMD